MNRQRWILLFVCVALFGLGWLAGRVGASGDLYGRLDTFLEVLNRIEQNYVDPVSADSLLHGAIDGMMRDLDPYSQFLNERNYENLQTTTQGEYGGVGLVVGVRDGYPLVISPIEGSPAWREGLRTGDVISKIEGRSAQGLAIDEVANRLRGPEGTQVTIAVSREDEEDREVTITREVIVTKAVPYSFTLEGGTGYVRLSSFSERSADELRQALEKLRAEGATRAVLDLRSNPGGLLDQAVGVAETFLPKGQLVEYTRGRQKASDQRFFTKQAGAERAWPLAVLIDEGSASASEIVAGALQDLDRALVVGQPSYGKGLVQSVFPLSDKHSALKLTTSRYYTPSGRSINRDRRDSLAIVRASNEDDSDPAAPHPALEDTLPKPEFSTAGGRTVYGGGGILPDVEVKADSLGPIAIRVERRALNFRFANRWAGAHAGARARAPLDDKTWREFASFLISEKVSGSADSIAAERTMLARGLRREIARRIGGDADAARVFLETDPVLRTALDALVRSRAASEVFANAGVEAPRASRAAGDGSKRSPAPRERATAGSR